MKHKFFLLSIKISHCKNPLLYWPNLGEARASVLHRFRGAYTEWTIPPNRMPLVIFFDLKTEKTDDNVVQTVEYQEKCDLFKQSKNNVRIIELVAYIGDKVFNKNIKNDTDGDKIAPFYFLEWMQNLIEWMHNLKEYEEQDIILVAHNNLFFHFHILKSAFTGLPSWIHYFDSMTLVKKFQLIGWLL